MKTSEMLGRAVSVRRRSVLPPAEIEEVVHEFETPAIVAHAASLPFSRDCQ